jgi:MOSC domain-containing protein YiiM
VTGSLASINISNGGVPKRRLPSCVVTANGLQGDRQRDLRYHGGPDRAVCLFSEELIAALQAEGHPIAAGTIGENLTIGGISWNQMVPGAQLAVGEVRLELTNYAAPCTKIAGSFRGGGMVRVAQKVNPGWSRLYARVLKEGVVRLGDRVARTG